MSQPKVVTDRVANEENVVDVVSLEVVRLDRVPIEQENQESELLNKWEQEEHLDKWDVKLVATL